MDLLKGLNASLLSEDGVEPGDPQPFVDNDGVAGVELMTANERYFWYHHTNADTMTMMNSTEMDQCAAVWTVVAYSVACLDSLLPHRGTDPLALASKLKQVQQPSKFIDNNV